jgi:hypothetical protein
MEVLGVVSRWSDEMGVAIMTLPLSAGAVLGQGMEAVGVDARSVGR